MKIKNIKLLGLLFGAIAFFCFKPLILSSASAMEDSINMEKENKDSVTFVHMYNYIAKNLKSEHNSKLNVITCLKDANFTDKDIYSYIAELENENKNQDIIWINNACEAAKNHADDEDCKKYEDDIFMKLKYIFNKLAEDGFTLEEIDSAINKNFMLNKKPIQKIWLGDIDEREEEEKLPNKAEKLKEAYYGKEKPKKEPPHKNDNNEKNQFLQFKLFKYNIKYILDKIRDIYNRYWSTHPFSNKKKFFYLLEKEKNITDEEKNLILKLIENDLKITWKYQAYENVISYYLKWCIRGISKETLCTKLKVSGYSEEEAKFAVNKLENDMKINWVEEAKKNIIMALIGDNFDLSKKFQLKEKFPNENINNADTYIFELRKHRLKENLKYFNLFKDEERNKAIEEILIEKNQAEFWKKITISVAFNGIINEFDKEKENSKNINKEKKIVIISKVINNIKNKLLLNKEEIEYIVKELIGLLNISDSMDRDALYNKLKENYNITINKEEIEKSVDLNEKNNYEKIINIILHKIKRIYSDKNDFTSTKKYIIDCLKSFIDSLKNYGVITNINYSDIENNILKLLEKELKTSFKNQAYRVLRNIYIMNSAYSGNSLYFINYNLKKCGYKKEEIDFAINKLQADMNPNWYEEAKKGLIYTIKRRLITNEEKLLKIEYEKAAKNLSKTLENLDYERLLKKRLLKNRKELIFTQLYYKGLNKKEICYAINQILSDDKEAKFWEEIAFNRLFQIFKDDVLDVFNYKPKENLKKDSIEDDKDTIFLQKDSDKNVLDDEYKEKLQKTLKEEGFTDMETEYAIYKLEELLSAYNK